jgi:hypothetical protein
MVSSPHHEDKETLQARRFSFVSAAAGLPVRSG